MASTKRILTITLTLIAIGILLTGGVGYYMFNKPARDVQKANRL